MNIRAKKLSSRLNCRANILAQLHCHASSPTDLIEGVFWRAEGLDVDNLEDEEDPELDKGDEAEQGSEEEAHPTDCLAAERKLYYLHWFVYILNYASEVISCAESL